jgi:hypothetical protein
MLWVQCSGFNALGSILGFNPLGSILRGFNAPWVQCSVGSMLLGSVLWVQSSGFKAPGFNANAAVDEACPIHLSAL